MSPIQQSLQASSSDDVKWLGLVVQNVKSLHYGVMGIIIHDSRVIQIERTERVRQDQPEFRPERT
jgi:hypothetical protein